MHLTTTCWIEPGAKRLARIRESGNYFRSELKKMGFVVLGDNDSPVMAIMLYNLAKLPAFSRACLRQNVSRWSATVCRPASLLMCASLHRCVAGRGGDRGVSGDASSPGQGKDLHLCFAHQRRPDQRFEGRAPIFLQVISEVGGLVGAKCLPAEPEKAKKMD
ncbi:hypothetical protein BHM03_00051723 [Ensete ventricosum]|nr:hypothetical protein BHM03_00051723 [Ensete ventricosum]